MLCQKLIATQNCLLVYGMQSVFDSLFVNQVKSTPSSSNDFDKENIRLKCRLINPHYFTNLERNSV